MAFNILSLSDVKLALLFAEGAAYRATGWESF